MLHPTDALIPNGHALHMEGVPYASAETRGPWSVCRFMARDGATYTAGKAQPVVGPARSGQINLPLWLKVINNGVPALTQFAADPGVTKAKILRAGNSIIQQDDYPQCARFRWQHRVKVGDRLETLELFIPNVAGFNAEFNVDRNGKWDGRVSGTLQDGRELHVLVADAAEKFPRGYRFVNGNLYLILHAALLPRDVSKAGVPDLRAYTTGSLQNTLPPEYVALLKTDPEISAVCKDGTSAEEQASRSSRAEFYVSLDFWLSIGEPVEPQAPLVLLDGFESPVWSKPKPGVGNEGLEIAERRQYELAAHKLATGPRGSILYGDFPEQPNSYFRVRGNGHYFWVTNSWRALLRTGRAEWYAIARAFGNYVRDQAWREGQQAHAKTLLPWNEYGGNQHWVDSEALLFAWLVDGDYLSLAEYQRWLAGYYPPTTNNRDSQVSCRMCRVAHWFTGDPKWLAIADQIEARITAEVERVKQTEQYKKYGVGMPTGVNWHPLAFRKPLQLDGHAPEGIASIRQYAASCQIDHLESLIAFGTTPVEGCETGYGPLGESHVGLQLETVYEAYRGTEFAPLRRVYYGTNKNYTARVVVDKFISGNSSLIIAFSSRKSGDYQPQQVYLTYPDGRRVELTAGARFPQYVDSGQGWVLAPEFVAWIDGWKVCQKRFQFDGPAGRYLVEVRGESLLLHAPLGFWSEYQDTGGEWLFPGSDVNGEWVTDSVLVGGE